MAGRNSFFLIFISGMSVLVTACSQGPLGFGNGGTATLTVASSSGPLTDPVMLQSAANRILTENCASCHMTASGQGSVYNLTDVAHLTASGLVLPGQPSQSPLYQEVVSNSMPPGGALSSQDKAILRDWITSLAAGKPPTGAQPTPTPPPGSTPPPTATPRPNVSFANLQATILNPKCVSCHGGGAPSAGIDLSTYSGVKTQVNLAMPAASKLYTEVQSGSMPKNAAALPMSDWNNILTWIQNGAPNN